MGIRELVDNGRRWVVANSPTLLLAGGIASGATAVALGSMAGARTASILSDPEHRREVESIEGDHERIRRTIAHARRILPVWLPTIIAEAMSITCLCGSYHIHSKRVAEMTTAAITAESLLAKYQSSIVRTLSDGKNKPKVVRDIADEYRNDVTDDTGELEGSGDQIFVDAVTGRRFKSTVADVQQAFASVNERLALNEVTTINDLYEMIGIDASANLLDMRGWSPASGRMPGFAIDSKIEGGRFIGVIFYESEPVWEDRWSIGI